MKKVLLTAAVLGFTALGFTAQAQEEKVEIIERKEQKEVKERPERKEKKETQEIIIRKRGDKDAKVTVEIKGDKITVNGKPISEFKDGDITINKREFKVLADGHNFSFGPGEDIEMLFNGDRMSDFKMTEDNKPRAFLGVSTQSISTNDGEGSTEGALISSVTKGSAAEKAGLKEGDDIIKVDDKKIKTPADLTEAIGSHKPNDEVTVYYKRDGKQMSTKAKLGETKATKAMAYTFSGPSGQMRSFSIPRTPMAPRFEDIPNTFDWKMNGDIDGVKIFGNGNAFPRQQKLGLKIQDTEEGNGVKVLDADKESPAEKAGLQKDDVVTEIDGKKISNTDDAREQLRDIAEKTAYNIKAKRNGKEMSFDIKIPKKLKTANL
jgi:serine protease Do